MMPWESLETLLRKIAYDVEGLRHIQIYGVQGQSQHGIDMVGVVADNRRHAIQGKRYAELTKADLTAAVAKFVAATAPWAPQGVRRRTGSASTGLRS